MDTLERTFPEEILDPLRMLVRDEETDYLDYIRTLSQDPLARKVKMAELMHNSDVTRVSGCNDEVQQKIEHLCRRYAQAKAILREEEAAPKLGEHPPIHMGFYEYITTDVPSQSAERRESSDSAFQQARKFDPVGALEKLKLAALGDDQTHT